MGSLLDPGIRSTMKFLLAFFALFASTCSASPFVAKIHVKEGEVEYDQTEAYDPLTSDVISHVPGHIRDNITLHEVVKIENELLGLAVWRLMEKEFCHIEKMEPERDPTGMMLDAVSYEARKKVMDIAEMTTVYVHAKDKGEWNGDRESLTRDMKELCNGLPIRLVENTNISKEEFDNLLGGKDRMVQYLRGRYLPVDEDDWWPSCGGIRVRVPQMVRSGNSDPVEEGVIHRIVVSD